VPARSSGSSWSGRRTRAPWPPSSSSSRAIGRAPCCPGTHRRSSAPSPPSRVRRRRRPPLRSCRAPTASRVLPR
jgi:hypothetical protein